MNDNTAVPTINNAALSAISRRRWIVSGTLLLAVMLGVSTLLIAAALYVR